MIGKVLVTYSTRTDSTKGVAESIGATLSGLADVVEVAHVSEGLFAGTLDLKKIPSFNN